ncbi:MAG TPA: hypothetical protein VGF61_20365 [Candidatus Acidoferrum sp.]|jgi:hypothetical protein
MRHLIAVCIFFCLLSVVSALTGVRTFQWSTSHGMYVAKNSGLINTLWSVFSALLYASAAYGIHRRAPVVWKLGWAVLIVSFLQFTIGGVSAVLRQRGGWIGAAGILVSCN